jgi:hypothetical protein
MDRVGITVLEDAVDAKPMYDTSDEATIRSQVSKAESVLGPCARHGARYVQATRFHLRKEMADRPIFG